MLVLLIQVITGTIAGRHFFKGSVGIESRLHAFPEDLTITDLTLCTPTSLQWSGVIDGNDEEEALASEVLVPDVRPLQLAETLSL